MPTSWRSLFGNRGEMGEALRFLWPLASVKRPCRQLVGEGSKSNGPSTMPLARSSHLRPISMRCITNQNPASLHKAPRPLRTQKSPSLRSLPWETITLGDLTKPRSFLRTLPVDLPFPRSASCRSDYEKRHPPGQAPAHRSPNGLVQLGTGQSHHHHHLFNQQGHNTLFLASLLPSYRS